MEKTRVKKGETYWHLYIGSRNITTMEKTDYYNSTDDDYFKSGDYFTTKEEAEQMARKLRAVLDGADVIETPSEEELRTKIKEVSNKTISDAATSFLGYIDEMSSTFCEWAIKNMINYFKSKIIK